MQLLLIRHGIAVERGTPGISDEDRPLTPEGEKKFRKAAQGLVRLLDPPDALLSSPLPRAHRTAEIAAEAWGGLPVKTVPALAGGSFADIEAALGAYGGDTTVAVVGHEPDLSSALARVLGSREGERLEFRKGGAALVDLAGRLSDGGTLLWFLSPKVLRELA